MRAFCIIVVTLVAARAVHAQRFDDAGVHRLEEHYARATAAYLGGRYAGAAAELVKAYALVRAAPILFDLALVHRRLGDPRAGKILASYFERTPGRAEREDAAAAWAAYSPARPPTADELRGVFIVTSTPAGARIHVDDRTLPAVGETPWAGGMPRGEHRVIVTAAGHREHPVRVRRAAGGVSTLHVILSAEIEHTTLVVQANVDRAAVSIDGKDGGFAGETPFVTCSLTPGRHTLEVSKPGYRDHVTEFDGGAVTRVFAELVPLDAGPEDQR